MTTESNINKYCTVAGNQEDYLKAFLQFSASTIDKLRYKSSDFGLLVEYNGDTYMVATREDFKNNYRYYFERESYDEIYTDTPEELWQHFLSAVIDFERDELVAKILGTWELYWEHQRKIIEGGEARYETMRNESFQMLRNFCDTLVTINKADTIKKAVEINDIELIPILAITIYNQYQASEKDNFYKESIDFLISRGEDLITDGDTFACVYLDSNNKDKKQGYYVYNPVFDYDV